MGRDFVIIDITEECDKGTRLIAIKGQDEDQAENGKVVFEILGDFNGFLSLESENSGEGNLI